MADLAQSAIIKSNPIGKGLDHLRDAIKSASVKWTAAESLNATVSDGNEDLKNLVLDLTLVLQNLSAARLLPSSTAQGTLRDDLLRFVSVIVSNNLDFGRFNSLFSEICDKAPDTKIWATVYNLVTETTPPPRPLRYTDQTPRSVNTSSFVNTSEHRKYIDGALKDELGSSLYVGVPGFFEAFFGGIPNLESISQAVFMECQQGKSPLYKQGEGWRDWPQDPQEEKVLRWLSKKVDVFLAFAQDQGSTMNVQRRPLAQPHQPLLGSTAQRKLDVGFVDDPIASDSSICDWSQILVPGELKSNPAADTVTKTWLDLARYAREVFAAQDTRRFIQGFTLCGSTMRHWQFDRLGGIASSPFDVNKDGLQFVSAILGYLWMNRKQLGFDPTILESDGKRYIEIVRNHQKERLLLIKVLKRHASVAGRATTCWKAYCEGDESKRPLVIKDSWQYPQREEEGEILLEATKKEVVNVARYYHHETVCVDDKDDDICDSVRKGLDITKAANYFRQSDKTGSMMPPSTSASQDSTRRGRSGSINSSIQRKRPSSSFNTPLPSPKRQCSSSPTKAHGSPMRPNRVHRRVVLQDYGKSIYKASSRAAMLGALEGAIIGHESMRDLTNVVQSDISIGNLMMNEDESNPSWPSFLIDFDLGIRQDRDKTSGAPKKTGTRAFMAIGALYGEKHSFMHDLESFFWVLFWVCVHYNGPDMGGRVVPRFEKWNYVDTEELAELKKGTVAHEGDFIKTLEENFTSYYRSLIPWTNRLRKVTFPNGGRWEKEDGGLYSRIREILLEATKDASVRGG